MFKKIILGILFAGISGALIYGGVYRTAARLETGNEYGAGGRQQSISRQVARNEGQNNDEYRNGSEGNGYQNGSGSGKSSGDNLLPGVIDQNEYTGTVIDVNADYIRIETDDNQEILVENRAWWYAQDAGFSTAVGNKVTLTGFFDDNGTFEVSWIIDQTNGKEVFIRESGGRPNWAGGGNSRGQNGRS